MKMKLFLSYMFYIGAFAFSISCDGERSPQRDGHTVSKGALNAIDSDMPGKKEVTETSQTIYGMHDLGDVSYAGIKHLPATANIDTANKKGWVVNSFELCTTVGKCSLANSNLYEPIIDRITSNGHSVIARLDWSYTYSSGLGTIPCSSETHIFVDRIEKFVKANKAVRIWVIGNEPNLPDNKPINCALTPELFASTYVQARERIRSISGHEQDIVAVGAIAPAAENQNTSWLSYYKATLEAIGPGNLGGIALHTYTFSFDPTTSNREPHDPSLISSQIRRYDGTFWHFQAYRSMMANIPNWGRSAPVYITETAPWPTWRNVNNGWVQKAYEEIDNWNRDASNQKIDAMILYRWVNWGSGEITIENLPEVQKDFIAAMNSETSSKSLSCKCEPDRSNFCLYESDTDGCPMTFKGGYCRPDQGGSPDWVRGFDEYQAQCKIPIASASCECLKNVDNFCLYPPSTPGCGMTFPKGYCDSNSNGSFEDADWVRGYHQYQTQCK